ncbi:uroporphyrinogen-III C-methyltransferase [Robiginitalea sp. M366]|uniref:uroporphyrinogen-III C-methyltransferase n=1 Tax=Robiginitalea aestuariiviva TaxID=3036903 RepID=UPI00240D8DA3|nr:uroporphyrinogen-III C-methyltransferase [Robiginitalea aestuariiviva]MDG1570915.1 uroporphyrinogen-III C-methyltransferase [Robiginitalea aestuariiviva]
MPGRGKLTLIGAGPGDPELITLKAVRLLGTADVVLYDALVAKELLAYAPQAEHLFVGKRKGCVAYRQPQIHDLIAHRGRQGLHVVRLKGGDPFVFGRGSEELDHAVSHGMAVEVVPGLSSSLAVPALQHIPMTLRGEAESFWVLTGTTRAHRMSADIALAARSSATVVILMGMSKIAEIMACFSDCGKSGLPVAVIQEGSTPASRMVVGTVATIARQVEAAGLQNPAVIVAGTVVKKYRKSRHPVPEVWPSTFRMPQTLESI